MDKRDASVYVRIPDELKRRVKKHAAKAIRNLNQEILYLIDLGLHVAEHTPGAWAEDEAEHDEK